MLRANSPLDDPHLRHLLDQRLRSVRSISEISDSPSLYSHSYFSPQPAHLNSHIEEMSSNFASPIHSDRDRLNDLAVSMLDMDDEPRSSYSSNDYDEQDFDEGDQSTIEQPRDDEDSEPPRMSLLGPKMRFHSKAPWEDNSPHEEEDESEDDADVRSVMSRNKSGPSRFRFGSKSSRDSSGSRRMAKKSFDTTSSQTSYGRGAIQ